MRSVVNSRLLNSVVAWAVALLGAGLMTFFVSGSLQFFGAVNDLPQYYAAAQLFVQNRAAEIYQLDKFFAYEKELFPVLTRGIGLFIPPLAVPLLVPLALIPLSVAPQIWTGLLSLALVFGTFLLARHFGLSHNGLAWLLGLVLLSGPAAEALRIGQLAPLLFFFLVLFMRFCRAEKAVVAGLVLALFVLKPQQMFPLVVFLLGARHKRTLMVAAGVAIALSLVSSLFFGTAGYMEYMNVVTDKANIAFMQPEYNPTVRGQVLRFTGYASQLPTVFGIGCLLLSAVFAFLLGRKWSNSARWLELGLLGALPLGLATSMHCHDYDLLLLVPSLVVLAQIGASRSRVMLTVCAVAAATFLQPFYAEIHYGYLKTGGAVNPHFLALFVFALCCAWLAWTHPEQEPAVAGSAA